jgi:hypothetical protein
MFKYILDEVAAQLGVTISLTEERTLWLGRINRAALTGVYNKGDFEDLMDETVLDFNVETQQVTLPSYVGIVRGMRPYDLRLRQPIDHPSNRYGSGYGNEIFYLKAFREKSKSPLARAIENESTLTFSIPIEESTPIVIALRGTTDNAFRATESVTIPAGSLSAECLCNFVRLESMRKNRVTTYDVTVKDADENELAVIPNAHYDSIYRVIQVLDTPYFNTGGSDLAMEVYYKKRFIPFLNDDDEFIGGSGFDDAIIFKTLELHSASVEKKIEFSAKFKEALKDFHEDSTAGKRRQMNFSKHPAIRMKYYDC